MNVRDITTRHVVWCDCGACDHQAVLMYLPEDFDSVWRDRPMVYLYTYLHPNSLWKRIKTALRHIFRVEACCDEIFLDAKEVKYVIDFLQGFINEVDKRCNEECQCQPV